MMGVSRASSTRPSMAVSHAAAILWEASVVHVTPSVDSACAGAAWVGGAVMNVLRGSLTLDSLRSMVETRHVLRASALVGARSAYSATRRGK